MVKDIAEENQQLTTHFLMAATQLCDLAYGDIVSTRQWHCGNPLMAWLLWQWGTRDW